MRLSEWRTVAPVKEAVTDRVMAVVGPVLADLGAEADPHCWVAWGDDPALRYSVLAPTAAGLVSCHVRVNIPQEGPRAAAKLVRWNRVSMGDLSIETQAGHRLVSIQLEGLVIRGVDEEADRIARFILALFAAIDGRAIPDPGALARGAQRAGRPPAMSAPGAALPAGASRAGRPPGRTVS